MWLLWHPIILPMNYSKSYVPSDQQTTQAQIQFMQSFYSTIQFNKDLLNNYYMPGYVEGTANIIISEIDVVPVLMEVISLMSKTGKKNMNECTYAYVIQIFNVYFYRKKLQGRDGE